MLSKTKNSAKKLPPVGIEPGTYCGLLHSLFSVFAGWSEVGEPSTDLQRSHASLPPEPVNCAVQHLRGLRLTPGISPAIEFFEFAYVLLVN